MMGNPRTIPINGLSRILIRGTNWIGDVIMTLPALAAVRKTYPSAIISVLAKPWVAELYKLCPSIDEVLIYESPGIHDGILGKYRLVQELKRKKFDLAILLQNAIEAAIITGLAGIPLRAGYNTDGRGLFLTHSVKRSKAALKVHQRHYYLDMLKALGCRTDIERACLKIDDRSRYRAEEILNSKGLIGKGPLVGMGVGAVYGPAKKWFPERFAEVANRLRADFGIRIMLLGSIHDKEQTAMVRGLVKYGLVDLAGATTLLEAAGLIDRCDLFISNDSGLMHIAGALGVPTLAIFGSTNPAATSPIGDKGLVIYKGVDCSPCLQRDCPSDFRCMALITVEEVYAAAREILPGRHA